MKKPNCKCYICGRDIYRNPNSRSDSPTCSRKCRSALVKIQNGKYVVCDNCGVVIYKKNSRVSSLNFCCAKCHREYRDCGIDIDTLRHHHSNGLYDNEIAEMYGCSRALISRLTKKYVDSSDRRVKIDDVELRQRISNTNRGKKTGKENHNFKGDGDYKSLARGLFNSISRNHLLKSGFTCEICGSKSGDKHVHHIKPFSIIVEEFLSHRVGISLDEFSTELLRWPDFTDETNLVTVCVDCHKDIHYGDNPVLSPYRWESATTIESTSYDGSE